MANQHLDVLRQLLILQQLPKLGTKGLLKLLSRFSLDTLFAMPNDALLQLGLSESQVARLHRPNEAYLNTVFSWLEQSQHYAITLFDDAYPALLKEMSDPPLILYVAGNPNVLHQPQVAIVGARSATPSGLNNAHQLAKELTHRHWVVTSGLAMGIDGAAHKGALAGAGQTVAVLGTGLNNIYPKRHQRLAQQIMEQGALISEFVPNTPAKPENFPRRNRIIAGLSLGTLVVEAAVKSGSLITARLALEQNREVFAVPGAITNPLAQGCHHLIKQGAKLVACVDDILEELPLTAPQPLQASLALDIDVNEQKDTKSSNQVNADDAKLLAQIDYDVTPTDLIAHRYQQSIDIVMIKLMELELSGLIQAVPGGYVRVN
ncbi:DNA-processing protein DprA [Flocculibacter collagenilyticus]|uniref:DNA-processing protein DprA n=1 Tax=Flocculibacter collagenilyticus TaxID=2744479 RepID=UPI001F24D7F6|nr:DNA-processing protein DprA [Flocculibacter collagenilyticus]